MVLPMQQVALLTVSSFHSISGGSTCHVKLLQPGNNKGGSLSV